MKFETSLTYSQNELFYDIDAKIKVVPKGRRFGLTRGASNYFIEQSITERPEYMLWGDVSYGNIQRYFERYWMPLLKKNKIGYRFNKSIWQLSFDCSPTVIDFRSAEHPASWEGFGYNYTFLNEAGIILKNSYIWDNCVRIMMLDYPDSKMIIGGTPKGSGGLYETLWNKTTTDVNFWGKQYSTYDNPLLNEIDIEELKRDIPSNVVQQEIYGKFIKPEDSIVDRAWIKVKEPTSDCEFKMYVDLAISKKTSADYTAIGVVGIDSNRDIFIADVYRDRLSFRDTCNKVVEYANKWDLNEVGIEVVAYQESMAEELERTTNLRIKRITPNKDKVTRFYPLAARMERGLVYLNRNLPVYFEKELLEFPNSEHDDMIDSISGAYEMHFTGDINIYTGGNW